MIEGKIFSRKGIPYMDGLVGKLVLKVDVCNDRLNIQLGRIGVGDKMGKGLGRAVEGKGQRKVRSSRKGGQGKG